MNVLKIGGAVCRRPETLEQLATACASGRWVLVHGGGPQITAALDALGEQEERVDGLRVTSRRAADAVLRTMDALGAEITVGLRARGIDAVHVPAADGLLNAVPKRRGGNSLGRVGTATSFDATELMCRMPANGVAIVTPVGWDAEGPLNVNADEGALALAVAVEADLLVLATDVEGVRGAEGAAIPLLLAAEAHRLLETGTASGGMVPKLENALEALATGVKEVRIGGLEALLDPTACTRMLPAPEVAQWT